MHFLTLGLTALLASPAAARALHYVFFDAPADSTYEWTVTNWIAQYSQDDALCSYSKFFVLAFLSSLRSFVVVDARFTR